MPGPPPTPTNVLAMRGSWRAKTRKDEPMPEIEAPNPPSWLRGEGRKEYRRVAAEMARLGFVSALDRQALYCYAVLYQQQYEIAKAITQESDLDTLAKLRREERQATAEMARALAALGLSPTSRTKVAKIEGSKEKNALEKLMEKKK